MRHINYYFICKSNKTEMAKREEEYKKKIKHKAKRKIEMKAAIRIYNVVEGKCAHVTQLMVSVIFSYGSMCIYGQHRSQLIFK